jgi:hypothetical protein
MNGSVCSDGNNNSFYKFASGASKTVGTGFRTWFARFENMDNFVGFPGVGEISKPQIMIKKLGEVDESFAGEFSKHSSGDAVCSRREFGFERLN